MRTLKIPVLLVFVIITILSSGALAENQPAGVANGKHGGTIVIGMKGDFDSFNELNAGDADALQVINHMLFMSLTRLDAQLETQPYLAEAWQFSEDRTRIDFRLRQDVYWSDGYQTTAEDVLFTYHVATDTAFAYPAVSRFDLVARAELTDRFTIRFFLKKPYPDVLLDLQMPILPKHILAEVPADKMAEVAFNRQPVGNGPFVLREWQANQKLIFEANSGFALGRPYLDRVIFAIIPDEAALLNSVLSGEIDLVPALAPQQKMQAQTAKHIQLLQYPSRGYSFVAWNLRDERLTPAVRRAFTLAIDQQSIIATLLEGQGTAIHGPVMPFSWAFDSSLSVQNYDPQQAKELLAAEGWRDRDHDGIVDKNGQPLSISLKTNAESRLRTDVAVMIQAQLQQIGVAVKIEPVAWDLLLQQIFERHDFDGLILGWDADFIVDPTPIWHSQSIENGYNFIGYNDPQVDALIERGRAAGDHASALPIWYTFQHRVAEACPYTFLFAKDHLAAANQRVRGIEMDARGFLAGIRDWWIPEAMRR